MPPRVAGMVASRGAYLTYSLQRRRASPLCQILT